MASILTPAAVDAAAARGETALVLEDGVVVTGMARDRAERLGIRLVRAWEAAAAAAPAPAPAPAYQPPAPAPAFVPPASVVPAPAPAPAPAQAPAFVPPASVVPAPTATFQPAPAAAPAPVPAAPAAPKPKLERPPDFDKRLAWRDDHSPEAIQVCRGEWCTYDGAKQVFSQLKQELAARGLKDRVKVRGIPCMALCQAGPVIKVIPDRVRYWEVTPDSVPWILDDHFDAARPVPPLQPDPDPLGVDSSRIEHAPGPWVRGSWPACIVTAMRRQGS